MSIFEELRVLDDSDELRTPRFASGLPLWPFVRWLAFGAAQERVLGLQSPFATGRTLRTHAEVMGRATLRNPLSTGRTFEIVIVGSSGGIVLQREGRWFDRINDYFAMEQPDRTLVLDTAGHAGYKTPRYPPHVRCFDTFDLLASVAARVRRPRDSEIVAIDRLVTFVRDRFPVTLDGSTLDRIRAQLVHYAVRLPVLRGLFARFFDRVRPQVLLIEDASAGAPHLCSWARDAGIATAEIQHGMISRSHLGYNLGDLARTDDAVARCLPRHLLLYGEFWKRETRTASDVRVLGCPHFSESSKPATDRSTILTISQGIRTSEMVRLTAAVARRFPDRRCVFRLHPGELAFRDRWHDLTAIANVEVSERGDIYEQFRNTCVVIGHSSTALIEATGSGLPVLVLDDETSRAIVPHDVGTWFRSDDELLALVESPPAFSYDAERFFAGDWRDRYRRFLSTIL